jgi:hypothetical protein
LGHFYSKPKICSIVGSKKGLQLYQADFSPKLTRTSSSSKAAACNGDHNTSTTNSDINSSYLDSTTLTLNENGRNADPIEYQQFKKDSLNSYNFKIKTHLCNKYGISIEVNDLVHVGKTAWNEHWEYIIEVKVAAESWLILRRFSRIRELHDKMCILYPSLNRMVFPTRFVFNNVRLLDRKMQLEHYLKCFLEILINDPTSAIYLFAQSSSWSSGFPPQEPSPCGNTPITTTNSISFNSISSMCSTSSPLFSQSNDDLPVNFLTKAKLCSFCSFFEETPADIKFFQVSKNYSNNPAPNSSSSCSDSPLFIDEL